MDYKVVVTSDAEADLDSFVRYLLFEKENTQAAQNLLDDFDSTRRMLERIAGSLKMCENPRLKKLGYRRINFLSHRYFLLYRIAENMVYIDAVFHELQDYENHIL
ncbi:type II toxin-antitoxin system RelE/ParE family toxin [Ventrimonas sp. CLA-AP-H27]|uniref:Type II toxin-antitoxin system RelE/ParE family toxin n=1 Tax=Ventrimonas faecis TaxID=3133170 RepID=A0ABV1HHA1_9FIRM